MFFEYGFFDWEICHQVLFFLQCGPQWSSKVLEENLFSFSNTVMLSLLPDAFNSWWAECLIGTAWSMRELWRNSRWPCARMWVICLSLVVQTPSCDCASASILVRQPFFSILLVLRTSRLIEKYQQRLFRVTFPECFKVYGLIGLYYWKGPVWRAL